MFGCPPSRVLVEHIWVPRSWISVPRSWISGLTLLKSAMRKQPRNRAERRAAYKRHARGY